MKYSCVWLLWSFPLFLYFVNFGMVNVKFISSHSFLQIDPQKFSYFILDIFRVFFTEAVSYLRECSIVVRRMEATKEKLWNYTDIGEPKRLEINLSHYHVFTTNRIWTALGPNLALGGEKAATNLLVMPQPVRSRRTRKGQVQSNVWKHQIRRDDFLLHKTKKYVQQWHFVSPSVPGSSHLFCKSAQGSHRPT